jgi:heme-degrading monooxygenase HmoA
MIQVLFWSRLRPDMDDAAEQEYQTRLGDMVKLAESHAGFISHKTYTAPDGERLTVVEFEDEAALNAWRDLPQHREAQHRGRQAFYDEYRTLVLKPLRGNTWKRPRGT